MKEDEYVPEYVKRARRVNYDHDKPDTRTLKEMLIEHDIEEILQRLKQLEENQEQIIEILWDELKIQVRFIKSEEL